MAAVHLSLFAAHVSGRDHPDEVFAQCENQEQFTSGIALAEREEALLLLGMRDVSRDDQGLVEEDLLALAGTHLMRAPVLLCVPIVPLEAARSLETIRDIHADNVYGR